MTLIKKRDVKDYFSARRAQGSRIHVVPAVKVDAAGVSAKQPVVDEPKPLGFNQDFTADHSSSSIPHKPAGNSNAPKAPKG
jgi:hypothetical protein